MANQLIQLSHRDVSNAEAAATDVMEHVVLEKQKAIGGGLEVGEAEDGIVRLDGHFTPLKGPHELSGQHRLWESLSKRTAQPCAQTGASTACEDQNFEITSNLRQC